MEPARAQPADAREQLRTRPCPTGGLGLLCQVVTQPQPPARVAQRRGTRSRGTQRRSPETPNARRGSSGPRHAMPRVLLLRQRDRSSGAKREALPSLHFVQLLPSPRGPTTARAGPRHREKDSTGFTFLVFFSRTHFSLKRSLWGAWTARSVKPPTPDLRPVTISGLWDPAVLGSAPGRESTSLLLALSQTHTHTRT